jgi:hypothetical protein
MRGMQRWLSASCVSLTLTFGVPFFSVAPAAQARPADATAQCKDGTYSKSKTKQGACSTHGGVATWYADQKPAAGAPAANATPPSTPPTTNAPTSTPAPKTTGKVATTKPPAGTPDNATAKCKDGTYSFAKQHSGACSHHGGVAEWYK